MPFLSDITPILSGPLLRSLAIWVELVTFALTLLASFSIFGIVIFGLTFFLVIFDLVIALKRRKARKACRVLNITYTFQPKVWVIVVDFLVGLGYTVTWVLYMISGSVSYYDYYGARFAYSVFGAHVLIGMLCVAHMHLFFGSVELHILRQQRNGKKAAARAHSRWQSRDAREVQLAQVGEGPSQV